MFHNAETGSTAFVTLEMSEDEVLARMQANTAAFKPQSTVSGRMVLSRPGFCSILRRDTALEAQTRLEHTDSPCPLVNLDAGRRLRVLGRRVVELPGG